MKTARKKNSLNAKGRNKTTRFTRLDHSLLHSKAYRALSPKARALLIELTSLDNDRNNGSLYLSVRDAAARMGVADLTAARKAFDELQQMGFIQMTQAAHFSVKASEKSRARCWRLTWRPGPGRRGPSNEFLDREPAPKTLQHARMERGLKAIKAYKKAIASGNFPVLDSDTNPLE